MDYQEQNQGQPQVQYQGNNNFLTQIPLPNATASLTLGILSIVFSCCCLGIGVIFGVIGLILGIGATNLYVSNRDMYSESSFKNANAGKICSIIGLAFGLLSIVMILVRWSLYVALFQSIIDGTFDPNNFSSWF